MGNYNHIERKIDLIKKCLERRLEPDEQVELENWLNKSGKNREMYHRIRDRQLLVRKIKFCRRNNKEVSWKNICRKTGLRSGRIIFLRKMWYAAGIALFLMIGGVYRYVQHRSEGTPVVADIRNDTVKPGQRRAYIELSGGEKIMLGDRLNRKVRNIEGGVIREEEEGVVLLGADSVAVVAEQAVYNKIVVPRGGEYQMVLADGTKVWLNSDSQLDFPFFFNETERVVYLKGEAYFKVQPDKDRPFRVRTDGMETVVLGTSFNMNAYQHRIYTTLVEGKIVIHVKGKAYDLNPGDQADLNDGQLTVRQVDVFEYVAWKEGKFVFNDRCLEEVLTILSRWYDVDVFYQNAEVKDLHFTGNIPRHATIAEVVKFLERTDLVRFCIQGRTMTVSKN